jgi:hypothetical protein
MTGPACAAARPSPPDPACLAGPACAAESGT